MTKVSHHGTMEGEEEEIYNTGNTEYAKEKFQSYLTEDKTWEDIKWNDLKTQKVIYIRLYGLYLPSLRIKLYYISPLS